MVIQELNTKLPPPVEKGLTEVCLMIDKSREYRERKALRLLMAKLLSVESCAKTTAYDPDTENDEARTSKIEKKCTV